MKIPVKLKVVGLQRSGTNYLTELLKINFTEFVFTDPLDPFFKHSMPQETFVRLPTGTYKFPFPLTTNCNIIHIKKTKEHWLRSIKNNPMDLYQKRPGIHSMEGDLYDCFVHNWSSVYTVQYENLLNNFQLEMCKIQEHFHLDPKQFPYKNISKVPHNKTFTEDDKKRYLS
jgi:hypothetical protein